VPLFGGASYDRALERDAVPIAEQLAALGELVAAGKVRAVGVSNETSLGVMQFVAAAAGGSALMPKIASIQNSYSLLNRGPFETDLAEVCSPRNCNVGLLAYSPLAGGALSGKYLNVSAPPVNARFTLFAGYMERFNKSMAREAVAAYADVAAKHGMSPATLALAFVRSRSFVTSTIIGATSMEQLRANIDAFDVNLTPEALADVNAVFKRFRDPATDA
jgi:aryl-alcohol dehydrogenase-like predicted oxidoreductase